MGIKHIILPAILAAAGAVTAATSGEKPSQPLSSEGKAPHRSEFISYSIREEAEAGDPSLSQHYLPMDRWQTENVRKSDGSFLRRFSAGVNIPYMWLDRDLFIHVDGAPSAYRLYVNGREVGFSNDNRTPSEFEISDFVKDGPNRIWFDLYPLSSGAILEGARADNRDKYLPDVYLHSQPKVRIYDYYLQAGPDSLGNHGRLTLDVIVSNSYKAPETVTIGYDIYSPAGKLQTFDLKDITVCSGDLDTLRFEAQIDNAFKLWKWSPSKPNLFRMMLTLKRGRRIVEYIPFTAGFRSSRFEGGRYILNGMPFSINAAAYNAASIEKTAKADLAALKAAGINTVCVDYPQPRWFYGLCDRTGLLVIDQANINSSHMPDDRRVGGTPANDPRYLKAFTERMDAMQNRSKNHPSVIAWSMGGHSGNGYNLYKGYQYLKGIDSLERFAVTYRGLEGEWNSDFVFPTVRDGQEIINIQKAKPAAKPRRR